MRVTHDPRRGNRFCGPAALSAIAGIDTYEAARILREVEGKRLVMGVTLGQMRKALTKLDYRIEDELWHRKLNQKANRAITLAQFLRDYARQRRFDDIVLISAGGHLLVWQGVSLFDNAHPDGIFAHAYPRQRSRMKWSGIIKPTTEKKGNPW